MESVQKDKRKRVLVFPGGTEIGLEILASLKDVRGFAILAAGVEASNPATLAFPEYHALPPVCEPGWEQALARLCERLDISYLIPAHDDVIEALARTPRKPPCVVVTSPDEVCLITRSKSRTYAHLRAHVRVPKIYAPDSVPGFPVFVKPDRGNGSIGACRVDSPEELRIALGTTREPLVCEYLPGEEYTVDCFSDREQGLLFSGARLRLRTRNGISVNTVTVDMPEAEAMARAIAGALDIRGAWFFQFKRAADGDPVLLEVAPRIAGAMAAHRVLGVNFALLSILEQERVPLRILRNPGPVEVDRSLRNRYRHGISFDTVYVDLDDTLIHEGRINTDLVALLYACVDNRKTIVLVTRHAECVDTTLARHRLTGLFDRVVHLRTGEKKSSCIEPGAAIFIDDSFSERLEVASTCGIPTFDCSMVEMLYDQERRTPRRPA